MTNVVTEGIHPMLEGVAPYALDVKHAAELWASSEKLVGETF